MDQTKQAVTTARWVSYEQAGLLYGLSRWTLLRLAREGHIRAARVGRVTRLDAVSIEAYLSAQAESFG